MVSTARASAIPQPGAPLRPFDARRDLSVVADLIELGFQDTLDDSGRRYLEQLRRAAHNYSGMGWLGMGGVLANPPMSGYVWEEDGQVVGNLSLIPYFAGMRRYYLIANVVVHPNYRRRGIGRGLTARAIEQARLNGAPEAWLHVRPENPAAIRLYESLGFVERARRTTWQAQGEPPGLDLPPGVEIRPRRGGDWRLQSLWLEKNYPKEFSWQLPYKTLALQPGLLGGLFRSFNNIIVDQWSLKRGQELLAVAALQSQPGYFNIFWLAAAPGLDNQALAALLAHARHCAPFAREVGLDYPAGQSETAMERAGFNNQHTLIWMSIELAHYLQPPL